MKLREPFVYFVDRSLGRGIVRRLERVLRRFHVPLVASLGAGGSLRVMLADGEWQKPPKEIK